MTDILNQTLRGLAIAEARKVNGCLRLVFSARTRLSIFNAFTLTEVDSVSALAGKIIAVIEETAISMNIHFLGGGRLVIDMSPKGFRGVESMMLHRAGQPVVVLERARPAQNVGRGITAAGRPPHVAGRYGSPPP